MSRAQRLCLLGSLYLVTNIGFSFFFLTLSTILLNQGLALEAVAAVNLLGIIYFAKFLAAPLVDRLGVARIGHYRGWLVSTQLALIAAFGALALLDPHNQLAAVLAVTTVVLVFSMLHDVALGGLALRLLPPAEYGTANGLIVASGSASMLVGSGGALMLYGHSGWAITLSALAAVYLLPLGLLLWMREPAAAAAVQADRFWPTVRGFFRPPRTTWTLLIVPLFGSGVWLANAPIAAMLLDAGWSVGQVGLTQMIATSCQALIAVAAGRAISQCGMSRSVVVIGVASVCAVIGLLPLSAGHAAVVPTIAALIAMGAVWVASLTWFSVVSMRLARAESPSTDYSVPMSIEAICVTLVGSAGLALAGVIGFGWLIGAAVILMMAGTVVAVRWARLQERIPVS
ncbi:hypothetical protein A5649_10760 [Mycolicibacter heraklionensis]|uniref:MFS transporter n=1 Tax=Mycolicibacter heraklionensis TaxID=512402 RepID=A0AA91EY99_9MYCO|nr:MFS transporter [Mycolicibacter heraklionensis]OBK81648.1 hypothetical protein A5649_10760 [Mycolicibacter heraklionensis]